MNIIIFQAATEGDGVDVIIEMMANVNLQKDLEMINYHGRIVVCSYIIHNDVCLMRSWSEINPCH